MGNVEVKRVLRGSVIIPTFNRPKELRDAIQSILGQTVKPHDLIIVDDGNLPEPPLKRECEDAGIRCIFIKKESPGLTASRNIGIQRAAGDIIFFFDDDVVLSQDYLEEVLKVYENDTEGIIGGVGGFNTNRKFFGLRDSVKRIFYIAFLVSGLREGRVLPSGFCTTFGSTNHPTKAIKEVHFLPGCAMSFRKDIFKNFLFSEQYKGYGLGEDIYFSYQVSKKYKLILNPNARLVHLESFAMRPQKETMERMFVLNRFLFFRDHVKSVWWSWIFFYYALFGYTLLRTVFFVFFPNKVSFQKLKGVAQGIKEIILKRQATVE